MLGHPTKNPGTGNLHADNSKAIHIQITHDALVQALEKMQSEWERDRNNAEKEL